MLASILFVIVALVGGIILRERFRFLAYARIPASLVAGAIGLLCLQWVALSPSSLDVQRSAEGIATGLREWPGWLIAVVFAGMLLVKPDASEANRSRLSRVGREGLMVWIIVLGQTTVGLWVTWWLIQPWFDLPNSVGMLIETGFAGGHGTAAAMGTVLKPPPISFDEGLDLGVLMATGGLVYGLVSGVLWINLAIRLNWISVEPTSSAPSIQSGLPDNEVTLSRSPQAIPMPETTSLGRARIGADALDPLLLQLVWLMLAFGIGIGLQQGVHWLAVWCDGLFAGQPIAMESDGKSLLKSRLQVSSMVGSFPLFIYTLFGGLAVRFGLQWTGQSERIDNTTIHRLVGTSMDLLVVAAVATLNLSAVASLWLPFTALFLAGAIWSTFCLLVLSRWILPRQIWFQLGLINFGMSTGTTATGFVLLRVIDPDLDSGAAEPYALAAPLSAPFVGGGMVTIGLPLLVLERVPIWLPSVTLLIFLTVLVVLGIKWNRAYNYD